MPLFDFSPFSPGTFQFWSNPAARPKRSWEAMLIFPDIIFGGDINQSLEPYLIKSFSRPGYSKIETQTAEYQLKSGNFAKIDYPTQGFNTKPLRVTIIDVSNHSKGANTAAAINTSLAMQQKTMRFEKEAMANEESSVEQSEPYNLWKPQ